MLRPLLLPFLFPPHGSCSHCRVATLVYSLHDSYVESRRPYNSPTRKEHAELTRQRIADALIDLLVEEHPATVSIPAVAKRANVSVRTVYHHFPTKEALFDALPDASRSRGADFGEAHSPRELAELARAAFAYFQQNEALFNALRVSEASAHVQPELDRRALARADMAVESLVDRLDKKDLVRIRGLLGALVSYDS